MGYSKSIVFGDYLEIYDYEKNLSERRKRSRRTQNVGRKHFRLRVNCVANTRRKVKAFSRLVKANLVGDEKPALFTLTMFEVLGVKSAYKAFTLFIQRLRESFGSSFRYIAVSEYQQRGALHFHIIIWGLPVEYVENERSNRYFQNTWQRGFVDCIQTDGSIKLGGYLAKYLSKSLSDERLLDTKSYIASRNIMRPVLLSFSSAIAFAKEVWGLELSTALPLREREFETQWLGNGRYRLYKFR